MTVRVSATEQAKGALVPGSVSLAARLFQAHGIVALVPAVSAQTIAHVAAELTNDALTNDFVHAPDAPGIRTTFFNLEPPFSNDDLIANPYMFQVVRAVLGEFRASVYHSNVSMPGSNATAIHVDHPNLYEDGSRRRHWFVTAHFVIDDFSDQNGSTEFWPGTHLIPVAQGHDLLATSKVLQSVRANVPARTIILREPALWHRGMPNKTTLPRRMLSIFITPTVSAIAGQSWHRPLRRDERAGSRLSSEARRVWGFDDAGVNT